MSTRPADDRNAGGLPALGWRPVLGLAVCYWAVLAMLSDRYGFHRDELYFIEAGRHPAWSYPDQPPLVPLLARASTAVFGETITAMRFPAALLASAGVVVAALTARELGGDRRAQVWTAAAYAVSPFIAGTGHTLFTVSVDLLACTALVWLSVRWARTRAPGAFAAAAAVTAIALQTKYLVAVLLFALVAGMLIAGPREVPRPAALWAGAAVALTAAPALLWQHAHGWPQARMVSAIASGGDFSGRPGLLPHQVILAGLLTSPLWVYGLVRLFRSPLLRPYRFLGWAFLILNAVFLVTGGKPYYLAAMWTVLWAAGSAELPGRVPWSARAAPPVFGAAGVLTAVMVLPVFPVEWLAGSPQHDNSAITETVGWPELVAEVARVRDTLPPAERPLATIVTANYGEAGAIDLYGGRHGLPSAHSGHNGYRYFRTPTSDGPTIFVGLDDAHGETYLRRFWGEVTAAGRIGNAAGVVNQERGRRVWICREPLASWPRLWPRLARLGMSAPARASRGV
ncbi:glycosyltransferase family 39 protein [Spongiactinospora sp. TRM90649]|uniref:ArnT family glycosyltransferase n=1 Tax=Spongiactinospora sp. TRM90649 TaxID=3031114 RepID=UPI0023F92ED2|nr:glycosyltransferase family 39 protein [Spongiactinospora sp. TRM90649]MDF5752330.1 glycosyltransferase family 39 protein [Spongiactinospora sp. TRM90649]